MRPPEYRPLLLMIHGVNSTLEWSKTVLDVIEPHFAYEPVRYRYFHTLWGPVKVYIWPFAALLLVTYGIIATPHLFSFLTGKPDLSWGWTGNLISATGTNRISLLLLVSILLTETLLVIRAEITWEKKVENQPPVVFTPVVLGLFGMLGALIAKHPFQWVLPIASTIGIAFFLDLREYSNKLFSSYTLVGLPAVAMVLIGWSIYGMFIRQSLSPSCWVVLGITAIGTIEPFWRGSLAYAKVCEAMRSAADKRPFPFVVAHSLGTYLSGHVLQEVPNLYLGRIVFTGCVLERRYFWEEVVPPIGNRVLSVTNYVGRLDIVPFTTGFLRMIWVLVTLVPFRYPLKNFSDFLGRLTNWRPLGMAGFAGFNERGNIVHTYIPAGYCTSCLMPGQRALIHNIHHKFATHSTINKDKTFQSWSWLPCLWGMSPREYDTWLALCRLGSYYGLPAVDASGKLVRPLNPQNPDGFRKCEEDLLNGLWSWPVAPQLAAPASGSKLDQYVIDILNTLNHLHSGIGIGDLIPRLPAFIFQTVNLAFEESKKKQDRDLEILERLHPQAALRHAVLLALNENRVLGSNTNP